MVRAYALGAAAAFAGKAFLWGLGALGEEGPGHVIDISHRGNAVGVRPIGRASPGGARSVVIRHNGALRILNNREGNQMAKSETGSKIKKGSNSRRDGTPGARAAERRSGALRRPSARPRPKPARASRPSSPATTAPMRSSRACAVTRNIAISALPPRPGAWRAPTSSR